MHKPFLLLFFLAFIYAPAAHAQAETAADPGEDCALEGAWEVVSLTLTDPDGTVNEVAIGDPPGLKIFSPTHWVFVEQPAEGPVSGGGGRYTVRGNTYTEYVQYHAGRDYVGKTIAFECRVEGDRWYQRGRLPDGVWLEEVYRRAR